LKMKNVMIRAWEIYRSLVGDKDAKLSMALKQAWSEKRGVKKDMEGYKVEDGLVVSETLPSGKELKIKMKYWESPDKRLKRYYVERDGEQIGWISADKKEGKGQRSSTNQTYINRMIEALNK